MSRTFVEMAGRRLPLSNLEKDLYPSHGFTKAQILEYYRGIAPFMLPHLKDRAVTFTRYPEGVGKSSFFEKRCPSHRPEWVRTAEVVHGDAKPMTQCLVNDLETLIWAENLAALELHVPLARAMIAGDARFHGLRPGSRRWGGHPGLRQSGADTSGPALPHGTFQCCKDLGQERAPCFCSVESKRDDL